MVKNDNINIRLEVCKDKNSGKLSIRAHFDSNAPNIAMDKEGYIWLPTYEEKEFINEAFQLIPIDSYTSNKEKMQSVPENFERKPVHNYQKIEKPIAPSVFVKRDDNEKEENFGKNVFQKRPEFHNKNYETDREEPSCYEKEDARKKEERLIVEADDAAIEAALKRHMDDDKSFIEVDEQTIIDRVLNQKKKGKWNRKE